MQIKKNSLMPLILLLLVTFFSSLLSATDILVTIPPTHFLVKKIAGDSLSTKLLVPPGVEPHSFEPNAKELIQFSSASIWFQSGEGWERRAGSILCHKMKCLDLRTTVPAHLVRPSDSHIWLNPILLKEQAIAIEKTLREVFPDKSSLYKKNLDNLLNELDALDHEIREITHNAVHRTILVVHPAFGYFCDAYGFTQLAIEEEGKEPAPKQLLTLIQKAKEAKIHLIVISPEYTQKEASVLANDLNARIVSIDPYEENVLSNLRKMASEFSS